MGCSQESSWFRSAVSPTRFLGNGPSMRHESFQDNKYCSYLWSYRHMPSRESIVCVQYCEKEKFGGQLVMWLVCLSTQPVQKMIWRKKFLKVDAFFAHGICCGFWKNSSELQAWNGGRAAIDALATLCLHEIFWRLRSTFSFCCDSWCGGSYSPTNWWTRERTQHKALAAQKQNYYWMVRIHLLWVLDIYRKESSRSFFEPFQIVRNRLFRLQLWLATGFSDGCDRVDERGPNICKTGYSFATRISDSQRLREEQLAKSRKSSFIASVNMF